MLKDDFLRVWVIRVRSPSAFSRLCDQYAEDDSVFDWDNMPAGNILENSQKIHLDS